MSFNRWFLLFLNLLICLVIFASPILYQTVLISLISLLMSSAGRSLLPKIPLIYLLVWFGMLLGMWLELECYWKMVGCWVWVGVLLGVCIGVLECGCWSIPTRRGHYCWKSSLKSYCWNISINLWKFCWVTWLGFWGYNLTVLFYIWHFFSFKMF